MIMCRTSNKACWPGKLAHLSSARRLEDTEGRFGPEGEKSERSESNSAQSIVNVAIKFLLLAPQVGLEQPNTFLISVCDATMQQDLYRKVAFSSSIFADVVRWRWSLTRPINGTPLELR